MNRKKYDPGDGEWGQAAESRFREYIKSSGYEAIHHPNGKYGPDIEYESESERFYVAVERAGPGRFHPNGTLKYRTLHVPARRPVTLGTMFVTVSDDMSNAYVAFPEDLLKVTPTRMDNRHVKQEEMRDHEIMRCLPLDLSIPIRGSLARMNVTRVRQVAADGSFDNAMRALRGVGPFSYGCPYGMDQDEWTRLILSVEQRCGLNKHVRRSSVVMAQQQPSLFEKSTQFWS